MPSSANIVIGYPNGADFPLLEPLATTVYVEGIWRGSTAILNHIKSLIII